ncbi:glycosyltransferase [Fictibacillus fluitans]|uniref:Glycosyltransferase n=1 Tax=Fictibacillus fluitans TaxID=3058422 RepID=A0ABT8HSA7_9BACL|nr:glycosyltransferase [Fictibacillus sp. NE201]MDN4523624.1 glycosyltransferase [Fictibacillus sp. NE201]
MKKGVNLFGYNRAELGVGESCRLAASALEAANIPFCIINYPFCSSRQNDLTWQHKEVKEPKYDTNIFHINADQMIVAHTHQLIKRDHFKGRYNIGVWHWELPDFPESFCPAFKLVDEIWAPTHFIKEAIGKKSPVPVHYVPHGLSIPQIQNNNSRQRFQLPIESFLFLAMYDPCSSQMRKNPTGVIDAYKKAFQKSEDNVGLVIKINNNGFDITEELEELNSSLKGYKNVYIINKVLNKPDLQLLMNSCDAFISLHRSEGFGLSLAEAMCLGKPVIATNWSGNTDFMDAENSCCVSYSLIHVEKEWGPYQTYQMWADPDLDEAAFYMRKLFLEEKWYQQLKKKAIETFKEWSPERSGMAMKQRLQKLHLL